MWGKGRTSWTFDHGQHELMQFTASMLERFDFGKVDAVLGR